MRWNHGHSWAAGILTGIVIDQHSFFLIAAGGLGGFLFARLGATIRSLTNRRWTIRS